jgi:hypothetical protein
MQFRQQLWCPDIIRAVETREGVEMAAGAQMSLAGYVATLHELAATLPGASPRYCLFTKTKMSRVSMFLKLFPMVCLIKDKNRLNENLIAAANILFPGYGSKLPTDLESHPHKLKLSMKRLALSFDIAFMQFRQQLWCPDTLVYCWADASPQAGREWFLSQQTEVDRKRVVETWKAALFLEKRRYATKLARNGCGGFAPTEDNVSEEEEGPGHDETDLGLSADQNIQAAELCILHSVRTHVNVPAALGLGRATLVDKAAALAHAWFLETPSMAAMTTSTCNVVSFTTDMGTEMGLSALPMFGSHADAQLLPQWMRVTALDFEMDIGVGDGVDEASEKLFLRRAIAVPGLLHIFHNMMQDVDTSLSFWRHFWPQVKNIERLFTSRIKRERVIARCFKNVPHYASLELLLQDWTGTIHEERWGDIVNFLFKARPVLLGLRAVWNEAAYRQNITEQERDEGEEPGGQQRQPGQGVFSPAMLTQTLRSNKWFVYLDFVLAVHNLPTHLTRWAEACGCHGGAKKTLSVAKVACPMKGCKVPEMACGDLGALASDLFDQALLLLLEKRHYLSDSEWSDIISDFESARGHVIFVLQVKTDFAKRLPWLCAGLAHRDEDKAKQCFRQCVHAWESLNPEQQGCSHYLSKRLLAVGPCRYELDDWAASSSRDRNSLTKETQVDVATLKFIPCVERSVERLHSLVKWGSKHGRQKRNGSTVSMAIRSVEIFNMVQDLSAGAAKLQTFADILCNTIDLRKAASLCRMAQHPLIQNISRSLGNGGVAPRPRQHAMRKVLETVVYRCDVSAQFQDLAKFEQVRRKHALAERNRAAAEAVADRLQEESAAAQQRQQDGLPVLPAISAEKVVGEAFVEHFRLKHVNNSACEVGRRIFSVPSRLLPAFVPVSTALAPGAPIARTASVLESFDFEPDIGAAEVGNAGMRQEHADLVFFSTLPSKRPSKMKTVPVGVAGKHFAHNDVAVLLHSRLDLQSGGGSPVVSARPNLVPKGGSAPPELTTPPPAFVLRRVLASEHQNVLQWSTQTRSGSPNALNGGLMFSIQGFEPPMSVNQEDVSKTLSRLFLDTKDSAWVSLEVMDIAARATLLELRCQGFASCSLSFDDQAGSTWRDWQLTREGILRLEFGHRLCEPRRVSEVSVPLQDENILGATAYELIRHMEAIGWSWERLPKKPSGLVAAFRVGNDQPLVWRTRSFTVSPTYLKCLLLAQKLKDNYGFQFVPHGAQEATYAAMLKGQEPPKRKRRRGFPEVPPLESGLELDVGATVALAPAPAIAGKAVRPCRRQERRARQVTNDTGSDQEEQESAVAEIESDLGDFEQDLDKLMEDEIDKICCGTVVDPDDDPDGPADPAVNPEKDATGGLAPGTDGTSDITRKRRKLINFSEHAPIHSMPQGTWGCFRVTDRRPGPNTTIYGGLSATCPFHLKTNSAGHVFPCTKFFAHRGIEPSDIVDTSRRLQYWCSQALHYNRGYLHAHFHPDLLDCPEQAAIDAIMEGVAFDVPSQVQSDQVLDNMERAAAHPLDRGAGRGRRGRGQGRGKRQHGARLGGDRSRVNHVEDSGSSEAPGDDDSSDSNSSSDADSSLNTSEYEAYDESLLRSR